MKNTDEKNKPLVIEAKLRPEVSLELDSEYEEDGQDEEFDAELFKKIFWEEIVKYEFE